MKSVIVFLALSLTGFAARSQSKWGFGLKAGLNLNLVKVSQMDQLITMRSSYIIGGYTNYKLTQKISLQGEVLYSRKGYGITDPESKVNMNYLSVPILLIYSPLEKLSVELGPEVGYLMSSWIDADGFPKSDNLKWFSKYDLAVDLGLHYYVLPQLGVGARFAYGLVDIYELDETYSQATGDPSNWSEEYYNRTIQFSINYKFKK